MCKLFILPAFFAFVPCFGATSDPVADFLRRSDKAIYRGSSNYYLDDRVYRFDVDLNRDGKKEVLLSSTLEIDGKQGNVFFVYGQVATGSFEPVGEIHLNPGGFYLGPIDEISGWGIIKFWPAGGGTGGYSAYVFDGTRINETPLGAIDRNQQTSQLEGKGIEIAAKYSMSVSDSIRDQVERLRKEQGYAAPEASAFVAEAQSIPSDELANKYGIKVEPKTYQQGLRETATAPMSAQNASAAPTVPSVASIQPSTPDASLVPADPPISTSAVQFRPSLGRWKWVLGSFLFIIVVGLLFRVRRK